MKFLKIYCKLVHGRTSTSKTLKLIKENKPDILICGHSHILKVVRDTTNDLLFINPGACGKVGFHKKKTILRFDILENKIDGLEVIELS